MTPSRLPQDCRTSAAAQTLCGSYPLKGEQLPHRYCRIEADCRTTVRGWIAAKLKAVAMFYLRAWVALPWIIFGMVVEGLCFFAMIAGHSMAAKL